MKFPKFPAWRFVQSRKCTLSNHILAKYERWSEWSDRTSRSARNARSLRKQSMVSMTTKAGFRAQARAAMAAPRSAAVRRSSPSLVGASESALATTRKSLYNRNATCGSRMIGHVDPRSQLRSQGPVSCRAASYDYDVCIIGCGVGGHGAALHAVQQGTSSPSFLSGSSHF